MTVTVTTTRKEPLQRTVLATGSVHPWQEVVIGPEVGGYRVSAVLVDVGDKVKSGQVLVRLSNDLLQAEVSSRRAAQRSAQADAANTGAALRRGETVLNSGALSAADLDRLRAEQIAAQARVDTATSDLQTSELRLRYTNVTAPDDGVVTSRTVNVGQIAQAGTEMLRVLRQSRVEWRAEVPESQLSQIKPGQTVNITSADGGIIVGVVRAVAPTVQVSNRTALVYVDIKSGNARPGMYARGRIDIGSGDALLVPVTSVVMQDGYSYVFVLKDKNVVERRLVHALTVHDDNMEIASGVTAGEVVAVKGAGFLKDGDTVKVVSADDPVAPPALAKEITP
ncbi:MAG TPA: efflux RND transporter periplasmic adaptor subunit [Steroidobacteraceae bacterium]|nr:efflux RND transporter periplasmic adaptor subunit [Steroidobacteraceae bacterium]